MSAEALALEQLMLHHLYPEVVRQLREAMPVAARDQDGAAADTAYHVVSALADHLGGEEIHTTPDGIPGWLRLTLLDAFTAFVAGTARTCRHSPDALRPQPVLAAAWKPDLITCLGCEHMFVVRGEADRRC